MAEILRIFANTLEHDSIHHIPLTKGITEKKFSDYTGFSHHALRKHRKSGIHPQDKVWFKDVTGRILYDLEGYNQWQAQTRLKHIKQERQKHNAPSTRQLSKALIK